MRVPCSADTDLSCERHAKHLSFFPPLLCLPERVSELPSEGPVLPPHAMIDLLLSVLKEHESQYSIKDDVV